MRKVITILIILCITFCACSKSTGTPVSSESGTNIPSNVKDGNLTPTATPTIEPTDKPIKTIIADCPVCGRKETECKELIKKELDYSCMAYIEKAYYLCDSCYEQISQNEHDGEIINKIKSVCWQLQFQDSLKEVAKKGDSIYVSKDGIEYFFESPEFDKVLKEKMSDIENPTTYKMYIIDLKYNEEDDCVETSYLYRNILDELKKKGGLK